MIDLFDDLGDDAGTDGAPALTNGEVHPILQRDGLDQIQKLTDNHIAKIDELSKSKEHEIMSV